ncbi:hypothetical protein KCN56_10470 [Photobacterium galatheae]|uniref:hypothetical protein n=1 Tax=Photobacterium galatheae TaxID=1654360 RepID=UPI00202CAAF0|nr:hypothetical protein [Photobacterium galatheae]MCM0148989.1 hypothetical protein [Photobacterium galatheae]
MKRYIAASILSTLILTACGGGDNGEGSTGTFNYDGIYVHPTDLSLMIVDSHRPKTNLILGDFEIDQFALVDSSATTGNTMITTGITLASFDGTDLTYDSSVKMKATFNNSSVTWVSPIDTSLTYTMYKTDDSLPLSEIVGTHTNSIGHTWTINADGSFTVNGICTISGNIKRSNRYFMVTEAEATQCIDSALNGTYDDGVLVTVPHNGQTYVAGIIQRKASLLWESAPIN